MSTARRVLGTGPSTTADDTADGRSAVRRLPAEGAAEPVEPPVEPLSGASGQGRRRALGRRGTDPA